ncbi:integral membrane protein MviN [Sulfurihydrogenibium sp. YO3AOP1]|uniref:murein biosynthesis integral membrane protein MurJ n=1 Tax=Sulfurihydrogenibium sp. (strain YO3AOP1) TaxID=436114 RepID=UPI000172503C|nr:murein biosynthesis integral membrane protein MurJ [Sulfurihydrogenibium sp. YO3AOP1]ACD66590.1 integral membrane protein MviN [Sulfurihydrogenibium sp. YO3AOP1]
MKFLKNTFIFSIATLISRVLGYLRDAVVAYYFGANPATDAFYVAWRLPNTLRQLVAEGSFNAAFIPIYTQEYSKSSENAKWYASSLFTYYTIVLIVLTLLVIIFAPYFVKIIAPGFANKGNFDLTVELVRWIFPYLILIGWTSFYMALLNTKDRFFIPAVAPALLNLAFVITSVFLSYSMGIYSLAAGALLGGFLQLIIQFPLAIKEGLIVKPTFTIHPEIKTTLKKLGPAFLSFGVSQFAFVIDTVLASFLMAGAVTYLYYGNRIFQLPLGVFIIGLGNALLVSLSKNYANKDFETFRKDLTLSLKFSIFISMPATIGMIFLGKEIIDVLLVRGAFNEKDAQLTYYALIGYGLGLLGYSLTRPFKSAFFAMGDTKTPLYSTMIGIMGSIISAIVLTFILNFGVFGLAFASSLGGYINTIYLYKHFKMKIDLKEIFKTFIKVSIAGFIMILFIEALKFFVFNTFIVVFVGILISSIVYLFVNYLLKEDTTILFVNIVKRKL